MFGLPLLIVLFDPARREDGGLAGIAHGCWARDGGDWSCWDRACMAGHAGAWSSQLDLPPIIWRLSTGELGASGSRYPVWIHLLLIHQLSMECCRNA